MKRLIVWLLAGSTAVSFAQDAGPALAVFPAIAAQPYGSAVQVVEIRGERGDPDPGQWTAIMKDPGARGGVREITFSDGQITSERTPLRGASEVADLPPIPRSAVSVDSSRVFQIAQREAVKNQIGFHWIDYRLAADPAAGVPVWDARLIDNMGASVGSLRISAVDGTLVRGFTPEAPVYQVEPREDGRVGGLVGRVVDRAESVGTTVRDTTLRIIGNVQETLVGERTIGPSDDE